MSDSQEIRAFLHKALREKLLIADQGLTSRFVFVIGGVQFTTPATFDAVNELVKAAPSELNFRELLLDLRIDRIKLERPDSRNRFEWSAAAASTHNVSFREWTKEKGRRPSSTFERVQAPAAG